MLKIAFDESYEHPVPEGHRFPMLKYGLIPEQLIYEGTITRDNLFIPQGDVEPYIQSTHNAEYIKKLYDLELNRKEERKIGFKLDKRLVDRERKIMAGTVSNTKFALEYGCSINVAGGTHHAFSNKGEGFCMLNDMAIGANFLLQNNLAQKILIVDLDVHQGNGTAEIFKDNKSVFTFSMHGEKNYPIVKEQSDLDVQLPDGINDKVYLNCLDTHLKSVVDDFQPDFIFYQAGVDILESDKLGRLGVSLDGCKKRDEKVLSYAELNNVPLAISMGGGYSEKIALIVEAHANTYRVAQEVFF